MRLRNLACRSHRPTQPCLDLLTQFGMEVDLGGNRGFTWERKCLVDFRGCIDVNLRSLKPLICVLFVSYQGKGAQLPAQLCCYVALVICNSWVQSGSALVAELCQPPDVLKRASTQSFSGFN